MSRCRPVALRRYACAAVALSIALAPATGRWLQGQDKRQCDATRAPKSLPSADALIDSSTILAVLSDALSNDVEGILLSLLYLEGATSPVISLLAPDSLSRDSTERVLNVFVPNMKAIAMEERNWAVRLRLRGGTNPVLRVERSSYCPAVALVTVERASATRRVEVQGGQPISMATPATTRPRRIDADVHIDAEGGVTDVQLKRGSGLGDLDAEIVAVIRRRRYLPAIVDGVPVPSVERTNGGPVKM